MDLRLLVVTIVSRAYSSAALLARAGWDASSTRAILALSLSPSGLSLASCGPGAPQAGTTDASSTTGAGTLSTTATNGTATTFVTSGTPTTSSNADTTAPMDSSSGAQSSASTTTGFETCGEWESTGVEPVPAEIPFCVDPQVEWNEEHFDCVIECSMATQLHGEGPAASLVLVSRITFSVAYGLCGKGLMLQRLFLGHPLAPKATVGAWIDCGLDPWVGTFPVDGRLADQTEFSAMMTIDGYAGDWISPNPVDPPRLFGSFSGDLVGAFEATHCSANDTRQDHCE